MSYILQTKHVLWLLQLEYNKSNKLTWGKEDRGNVDVLERWSVEVWNVQQVWSTWLFFSYPETAEGYMIKRPPFEVEGAQLSVSGSCSLPQLWPTNFTSHKICVSGYNKIIVTEWYCKDITFGCVFYLVLVIKGINRYTHQILKI